MAEQAPESLSLTFSGIDEGKRAAILEAVDKVLGESSGGEGPTKHARPRGPWGQAGGWFRDIQFPWSQSGGWMLVVREGEEIGRGDPLSLSAGALRDVRAALEHAERQSH